MSRLDCLLRVLAAQGVNLEHETSGFLLRKALSAAPTGGLPFSQANKTRRDDKTRHVHRRWPRTHRCLRRDTLCSHNLPPASFSKYRML
jgi:hypothetical protein